MRGAYTVPALPCHAIDPTLEFYEALGFEVTYKQARPNTYACVRRDNIDLHFFTMKNYEPANSYSTCLLIVPDVAELYTDFMARVKGHYGKRLTVGIPRITPLKARSSGHGFNVIDPGGNWIRISQNSAGSEEEESSEPASRPARALAAADLLANSKADCPGAAKILDNLLSGPDPLTTIERVQALVARAALAITLEDTPLARELLATVAGIELAETERDALQDELDRAADLEQTLG